MSGFINPYGSGFSSIISFNNIFRKDEVFESNDKMIATENDSAKSSTMRSQEDCATIGKYFQGDV